MDGYEYGYRRLVDSVSLLTPELPAEVGRMVVERGHGMAGKSLPMDAARCMVRDVSRTLSLTHT